MHRKSSLKEIYPSRRKKNKMYFCKAFCLVFSGVATTSLGSGFGVIEDNRARLEFQKAYNMCNSGFYEWNNRTCKQVLTVLATLKLH